MPTSSELVGVETHRGVLMSQIFKAKINQVNSMLSELMRLQAQNNNDAVTEDKLSEYAKHQLRAAMVNLGSARHNFREVLKAIEDPKYDNRLQS